MVVDHRYRRLWFYRVPSKGVPGKDLSNNAVQTVRLQIKTDQEPAMINVQSALHELNPDRVIPINSPVRESESNGRVDNTITRVQEKMRAVRHPVEHNIRHRIIDEAPIMVWLVRWSAELLSKYAVGEGGEPSPPYERIRREDCVAPFVPFGETVMHLPLKQYRLRMWEYGLA